MDVLKKVPVREQEAKVRATNFDEVCLGYNIDEAKEEASRCLKCKNAQCVKGCPVGINIPQFITHVQEGDIKAAADVIAEALGMVSRGTLLLPLVVWPAKEVPEGAVTEADMVIFFLPSSP